MRFHLVDVFAEERYAGNQLAVVRDCARLTTETMQRIAREMNFSETTFLLAEEPVDGCYPVRIFGPARELPFAGHPTLGTAFVIQRELIREAVEEVVLALKVGPIPVRFSYRDDGSPAELWMRQTPPRFLGTVGRSRAAAALGLDPGELDAVLPVQQVSTGLPFLVVPLQGLEALERIRLNEARYAALIEELEAKAILAFARGGRRGDSDLAVRVFAGYFGVPEDPATGSANGCLAAYLSKHCVLGGEEIDVAVEQGEQIGRPSRLRLRTALRRGEIEVQVGGQVVAVASGTFE